MCCWERVAKKWSQASRLKSIQSQPMKVQTKRPKTPYPHGLLPSISDPKWKTEEFGKCLGLQAFLQQILRPPLMTHNCVDLTLESKPLSKLKSILHGSPGQGN